MDTETTVSEKVSAVLTLDQLSNQYRVQLTPAEALELACNLGPYNECTPARLIVLMSRINWLIPLMDFELGNGVPNPNNGRQHHLYEMGREYSRVLYLCLVKSYFPPGYDFPQLEKELGRLAVEAVADEYWIEETSAYSVTYRIWWD